MILAVAGLPLAGWLAAGKPLAEILQFPPHLRLPSGYLPFSELGAGAVVLVLAAVGIPWIFRPAPARDGEGRRGEGVARGRAFPLWGWAAVAWTGGWWVLAWTRWAWFEPGQQYTFFPLWLGFIVAVNAAVERRTGSCLMRRWLGLFGVSAACWWGFEWLNRFVLNWHYLGAEDFSAWGYFWHATLCFATVLPAVAAVAEWISSHRRWNEEMADGPAWRWLARRDVAWGLMVFGGVSLFATGLRPAWFYPALWVSPLALALAAPVVKRGSGLARELAAGDWQRAGTWMIAAVICGFFWELWNWRSVAKWIYTVPGVDRWHLFEMPALGYAGYLPFGLECLLVAELLIGPRWRAVGAGGRSVTPASPGRSSRAHP